MKNILFPLICIVFSLLTSACSQRKPHSYTQIMVDSLKIDVTATSQVKNGDSLKVNKIIKLEDDSINPIGTIDKVVVTSEMVFVLDKTYSRFLYVFTKNGDLLYKIGKKGNGPGEYFRGPKDFYVDETLKKIIVFESESKKLFCYNFDGDLVEIKKIRKSWPYSFAIKNSSTYFAYKTVEKPDSTFLVRIQDANENTSFKYKQLYNKRDFVKDECFFYNYKFVYFVEDFNNDIVAFNNKGIEKIITIDFGTNSIEKDFLNSYKNEEFVKMAVSNQKATNITQIVETDELFAFQYSYKKLRFQVIQNKSNKKYLNGIVLNNGYFPSSVYSSFNNQLVSVLHSSYLDLLLNLQTNNPSEWKKIVSAAHPAIRKILLDSKVGQTNNYVLIYNTLF